MMHVAAVPSLEVLLLEQWGSGTEAARRAHAARVCRMPSISTFSGQLGQPAGHRTALPLFCGGCS